MHGRTTISMSVMFETVHVQTSPAASPEIVYRLFGMELDRSGSTIKVQNCKKYLFLGIQYTIRINKFSRLFLVNWSLFFDNHRLVSLAVLSSRQRCAVYRGEECQIAKDIAKVPAHHTARDSGSPEMNDHSEFCTKTVLSFLIRRWAGNLADNHLSLNNWARWLIEPIG